MDEEDRRHLEEVLSFYRRRLHQLELRAAPYGIHPPPELTIEIEELRAEIDTIKVSLQVNTPVAGHAIPQSGRPNNLRHEHSDKAPQTSGLDGGQMRRWLPLMLVIGLAVLLLVAFVAGRYFPRQAAFRGCLKIPLIYTESDKPLDGMMSAA